MPGIPNPVSDKSSYFGAAWNQNREALRSHQPLVSGGELLAHTVHGVAREQPPALPPYGGIGIGLTTLRVKSVTGEYLVCRTWDGTNEGASDINVAKPFNARRPATETIAGVVVNYTYTAGADALNGYRTAVGTGINETQVVIPYWIADGLIAVAEIDYSGVTVDGADLKLIEVSARCWAQI